MIKSVSVDDRLTNDVEFPTYVAKSHGCDCNNNPIDYSFVSKGSTRSIEAFCDVLRSQLLVEARAMPCDLIFKELIS